ncbi:ABC-three component system protein [Marinicellulosiphila megalodicopiae]|uniref:ABC-three component system protein n=1 Tax=Marinicellulosiphila megalodicopiae TaxID=2724896 RepID=UPI003BB09845
MSKNDQFNASASMLGYLYQIRYGLLLSLKKLAEVADPELINMSIELLDDVSFDKEGVPEDLLQTKFHSKPGNLTNSSPDIWKTIRVWVEAINTGKIELGKVVLTLVTTEALPKKSIAIQLGMGNERDIESALKTMLEISEGENKTNAKGYQAFKTLSKVQKKAFLNSIYMIGASDDLLRIREKMKPIARQSVPNNAADAFINHIEGQWFAWCIDLLSQTPTGVINLGNLQDLIDLIRPQYLSTNLPAEFTDALPDIIDVDGDLRVFIQQLRLFKASKNMLELAIKNYYRAFEQRNKWSKDGLLNPGELGSFDQKLEDNWKEKQSFLELFEIIGTEQEKLVYSAKLYQSCQVDGIEPIRPEFIEGYLSKGSYHILADNLKIGWHPEYKQLVAANEDVA